MVKCPRCGFDNPDEALYCMKCGYPLAQQPQATNPIQPNVQRPYQPSIQPSIPFPEPEKSVSGSGRKNRKKIIIPIGAIVLVALILLLVFPIMHNATPVTPVNTKAVTGGFIPTGGPTGPNYNNGNYYGYAFELPTTIIQSNPYGGNTGNFTLLNAIAIKYGVLTAVVWFYQPPNGQGSLLGIQDSPMSNTPNNNAPLLYIGTNGSIFAGDWLYYYPPPQVTTKKLLTGWHMVVIEEYANGSGKFYLNLYLDGNYIGTADLFYPSGGFLPQLFGAAPNGGIGTYPFGYIGTAYDNWPDGNGKYFFYNGTLAIVAFYNALLPSNVVSQMWDESQITSNGISVYLPTQNLAVAYVLSPSFLNPANDTLSPYYVNNTIMSELGITNPDLVLVSSGGNLHNNIWANYTIAVKTS